MVISFFGHALLMNAMFAVCMCVYVCICLFLC